MTRQQSDWLETALPERPDRWERRRRLTRILLPLLALLVIAAGILFGPRLLESPKPAPKKPTVVTVKPLGRTPTIAAAPAQAQAAAVNPDAIVADSSPSVPRAG